MPYKHLSVSEDAQKQIKQVIAKLNKKQDRRNVTYDEAIKFLINSAKVNGAL